MNTGVIDRFTEVFTRYIDSGFGLLSGEVAFLASTLIVIDVTLAGLFWAWGALESGVDGDGKALVGNSVDDGDAGSFMSGIVRTESVTRSR